MWFKDASWIFYSIIGAQKLSEKRDKYQENISDIWGTSMQWLWNRWVPLDNSNFCEDVEMKRDFVLSEETPCRGLSVLEKKKNNMEKNCSDVISLYFSCSIGLFYCSVEGSEKSACDMNGYRLLVFDTEMGETTILLQFLIIVTTSIVINNTLNTKC